MLTQVKDYWLDLDRIALMEHRTQVSCTIHVLGFSEPIKLNIPAWEIADAMKKAARKASKQSKPKIEARRPRENDAKVIAGGGVGERHGFPEF